MKRKIFNVLVFGAPGSGKGTISNKLVRDFQLTHLSTGDILRANISNNSELGKKAKSFISKGELVPDDLVTEMLLTTCRDIHGNFYLSKLLLDGFPRTINQAISLQSEMPVNLVLALDIPKDVIISRLSSRWFHPESGRTYAYDYNPPKVHGHDDMTGQPLTQREDDKPETIRKRLETYDRETAPLLDFYSKLEASQNDGPTLKRFSGTESNVIYEEIKKYLITTEGL